jgi:hypothetical protein
MRGGRAAGNIQREEKNQERIGGERERERERERET